MEKNWPKSVLWLNIWVNIQDILKMLLDLDHKQKRKILE